MSFPRYPKYKDSGADWRSAGLQPALCGRTADRLVLGSSCALSRLGNRRSGPSEGGAA